MPQTAFESFTSSCSDYLRRRTIVIKVERDVALVEIIGGECDRDRMMGDILPS